VFVGKKCENQLGSRLSAFGFRKLKAQKFVILRRALLPDEELALRIAEGTWVRRANRPWFLRANKSRVWRTSILDS